MGWTGCSSEPSWRERIFLGRTLRAEESDPQLYVSEIANGVFSLLKKEYAPRRTRGSGRDRATRAGPGAARHRADKSRPALCGCTLGSRSRRPRRRRSLHDQPHDAGGQSLGRRARRARQSTRRRARTRCTSSRTGSTAEGAHARLEADGRGAVQLPAEHVLLLPYFARTRSRCSAKWSWPVIAASKRCSRTRPGLTRPVARRTVPKDQAEFLAAYEAASRRWSTSSRRARHDPALSRHVPDPPAPRGLQADQPRRLHEPAGHLRPGHRRLLLHPDLQSEERQLLHPRRDRGPAADPRPRRDPRPFSAALDRQPSHKRDPAPAQRQRLRRGMGALRRGDADARGLYPTVAGRGRCCGCAAIGPRASAST